MTHGDMLNKENSNLVALFTASFALQFGDHDFAPRDRSAAKGPLCRNEIALNGLEITRKKTTCQVTSCMQLQNRSFQVV